MDWPEGLGRWGSQPGLRAVGFAALAEVFWE